MRRLRCEVIKKCLYMYVEHHADKNRKHHADKNRNQEPRGDNKKMIDSVSEKQNTIKFSDNAQIRF